MNGGKKTIEIEVNIFTKGNIRCCSIATQNGSKEYMEISLEEISEEIKKIIQERKDFFDEIKKKKEEKQKKQKKYQLTQRATSVEEAAKLIEDKVRDGFLYIDMIKMNNDYLIIYENEKQE